MHNTSNNAAIKHPLIAIELRLELLLAGTYARLIQLLFEIKPSYLLPLNLTS